MSHRESNWSRRALLGLLAAGLVSCATPPGAPPDPGIRVTALRLTAFGYMLDLRYRVTDPARAKALLDRREPAYLVDEASGMKLAVPATPKLGRLRQGTRQGGDPGRDYFVFFANPGRSLQPGAKVTLMAGDVRIPHLIVQ